MQSRSDVIIISAFGRGTWLAQQLVRRGLVVSLVDVSDQLGRWSPEDWAGPFGLFEDDGILPSADVEQTELPHGFTLWLQNRILEMRGPLTSFAFKNLGLNDLIFKYFKELRTPSGGLLRRQLEDKNFDEVWLAHFAQQFSSNRFCDNFKSLEKGMGRPLDRRFFLRRTSREKIIQSFREALAQGARVFTSARIVDISLVKGKLDAIEISSERSGVITGDQFVWMLSGEESEVFPQRVRESLYPKGAVESSWCWVRFVFNLPESHEVRVLPPHFVMMKDHHLPWTHSHCLIVQKSLEAGRFDFWARIPSKRRFQRTFLDELGSQIHAEIKSRIPSVNPVLLERPAEYMVSHKELGAPRFQVYSDDNLNGLKRLALSNLTYCGPEDWASLDGNGQHHSYQELLQLMIEKFKTFKKEVDSDRALHPS